MQEKSTWPSAGFNCVVGCPRLFIILFRFFFRGPSFCLEAPVKRAVFILASFQVCRWRTGFVLRLHGAQPVVVCLAFV